MRGAMGARFPDNRLNSKRFRGHSNRTNKQIVINRDIKRGVYDDIDDDYDLFDYAE